MLTIRENLLETIHGGTPDRFVKQYEFLANTVHPALAFSGGAQRGQENVVNAWGVTYSWRDDQPGAFPVHTGDLVVCKDIEEWQDYVKAPRTKFSEAEWEPFIAEAEKVDRTQQFLSPVMAPGIFEQLHALCEMENTMCGFYECPDEIHELIKYLTDYELQVAEDICDHLHPDALFHHDDWGSAGSAFFSADMFAEFFLEPYKAVYGYYKSRGVELVVHHSDAYCAPLVPTMIEMGIDIWQGPVKENDIPALIKQYGGQISFMGGINNTVVDVPNWTDQIIKAEVDALCESCGSHYFIPCCTGGMNETTFPEVYGKVDEAIDACSARLIHG